MKREVADGDGEVVSLAELTRASLEAALQRDGGGGVTVKEDVNACSGVACVFVIRSRETNWVLPSRIVVKDVSIPVFTRRAQSPLRRLVGDEAQTPFLHRPVLLVGAGGIGCELLKVLVLSGFKHVEVVDLDSIDATNLNRQFLFNSADVGMSKAVTARAAVLRWFEECNTRYPQFTHEPWAAAPTIVAHHDNIKDELKFGESFFGRFAAVLNALDNVSARQHVNRMCMKVNVPLFESGTMGYNGQVQPILKRCFECYDCRPKSADQKTFAVCTIHARPTTMVHCVHYAKELYETLFGERSLVRASFRLREERGREEAASHDPDNVGASTAAAAPAGEELAYLADTVRRHWTEEAQAGDQDALLSSAGLLSLGTALVRCLFHEKIAQLLAMKSSWSTEPPVALDLSTVDRLVAAEGLPSTECVQRISRDVTPSLEDSIRLFLYSVAQCCRRAVVFRGDVGPFRKEDDLAVDFVAATANLRARVFHIAESSVEELRTVAGAIVPAIATTNAMVAAGVVQQLMRYYASHRSSQARDASSPSLAPPACSMVYVRKVPLVKRRALHATPLLFPSSTAETAEAAALSPRGTRATTVTDQFLMHSVAPNPPNSACPVCFRQEPPTVQVSVPSLSSGTLGDLVRVVLKGALGMECPSVAVDSRIVYEEEDYEGLAEKPISAFGSGEVSFHVDALNKEVEWRVVVQPSGGASGDGALFAVSGLDEALAAEAALAARESKARTTAASEDDGMEGKEDEERQGSQSRGNGVVEGNTADNAIELGDDDNDDDAGMAATRDDVIEID